MKLLEYGVREIDVHFPSSGGGVIYQLFALCFNTFCQFTSQDFGSFYLEYT